MQATAAAAGSAGAVDLTGEVSSGLIAEQSFNPDEAFRLSNGTDSAIINYGDPGDINGTLSAVANFLSTAPAADLAFNFASGQILGKHNRDAAFAAGVARGEASYINGLRNRDFTGIDAGALVRQQTAGYIEFRQGQRAAFQAEYDGYNGFQKFGFNAGVSLFGGLINGGEAIGNLTAFTGIQGSTAAANAFAGLRDGAVDTFNFVFNTSSAEKFGVISSVASGVYDRYAGIYNQDGFGALAGTVFGETLSGAAFSLAPVSRILNGPDVFSSGYTGRRSTGDILSRRSEVPSFANLYPEDQIGIPLQLFSTEQVSRRSFNRTLNFVVTNEGALRLGRIKDVVGGGHIDLAIGNTVQAAGEVVFRGGQIKSINNASGHFQPFGPAARDAAIKGFNNAGFTQNNLSELYIEAYRRSALGQ